MHSWVDDQKGLFEAHSRCGSTNYIAEVEVTAETITLHYLVLQSNITGLEFRLLIFHMPRESIESTSSADCPPMR